MPPSRPPIELFSAEWAAIHVAAPPLPPTHPLLLDPTRLLTRTFHPRTPTDEQRLIDYHSYFHSQIAAMCNEISVRLEGEATVHGIGPDKDFFRQVVETLERAFSRTDDRPAVLMRARGLQSKLRWDIERFPNAPTRWRTVDAFVLEVLSTFHAGVLGGHIEPTYLWTYVAPLRFIHIDISAWVVYCTNPSSDSWKTTWQQFEQTHGPAAQAQREIGKERFVPRARRF